MTDQRFSEITPTQLFLDMSVERLQAIFDQSSSLDEDEMMCPFGMKPTTDKSDMVLAYFGIKSIDFESPGSAEDAKTQTRRVELLGIMLRIQKADTGLFAASNRVDALVFWRWVRSL